MANAIMKKARFRVQSQCQCMGEIQVQHVLPNAFARAIGAFVFAEHIVSYKQSLNEPHKGLGGKGAQACRGISTLTYILGGEVEHSDSMGNHARLGSGGVHWMMAGNGIIHDESITSAIQVTNPDISVIRFWINLPSKLKSANPDYIALGPDEVPRQELGSETGWIKILSGEYSNTIGKIPSYSKEFLYHIHLEAGRQFSALTQIKHDYAAFLPANKAVVNGKGIQAGELIAFTALGDIIEIKNKGRNAIDIILFGGESYDEPIVVEEAFVMNTPHEITQSYNDFYNGKYGQIKTW